MYETEKHQQVLLSSEIGKGGQGIVYEVVGNPNLVAKIYYARHRTFETETKLGLMLANPPKDQARNQIQSWISIAWPIHLLYENNAFCGYIMPRVERSGSILEFYNPGLRQKLYPNFDWRYSHRAARNLAIIIHTLHSFNYVMGDINQKNILVTPNALVSVIDTDSFQVRDTFGRIFRCPVGVPEYTPPELQNLKLDTQDRLPQHDYFGLAILLFQLLMEGFHPFTGKFKDQAKPDVGEMHLYCISQGIFPYQFNHVVLPPPKAPSFNTLHPEIQNLFIRCFVKGHLDKDQRPTARDWFETLERVEKELLQCSTHYSHWYSNHLPSCPRCVPSRYQPKAPSSVIRNIPLPPSLLLPRSTQPAQNNLNRHILAVLAIVIVLLVTIGFALSLGNSQDTTITEDPEIFYISQSSPTSDWTETAKAFYATAIASTPTLTITRSLLSSVFTSKTTATAEIQTTNVPLQAANSDKESDGGASLPTSLSPAVPLFSTTAVPTITSMSSPRTFNGHSNGVNSIAWSLDSSRLVSTGDFLDHSVRIWDVTSGEQIAILEGHSDPVRSAAWSNDGTVIASAGEDGTVRAWDVSTGQEIGSIQENGSSVNQVAWSPTRNSLASCNEDGTITIWDLYSGTTQIFTGHRQSSNSQNLGVNSIAWSPDGTQLASAGDDFTVRLWNVSTGQQLRVLEGHQNAVLSVVWSPDGTQLASAGDDFTVRLWNVSTGQQLRVLEGHNRRILALAWSPDGSYIASASEDVTIRIWNVENGEQANLINGNRGAITDVAWSPNGVYFAYSSYGFSTIVVYETVGIR